MGAGCVEGAREKAAPGDLEEGAAGAAGRWVWEESTRAPELSARSAESRAHTSRRQASREPSSVRQRKLSKRNPLSPPKTTVAAF